MFIGGYIVTASRRTGTRTPFYAYGQRITIYSRREEADNCVNRWSSRAEDSGLGSLCVAAVELRILNPAGSGVVDAKE